MKYTLFIILNFVVSFISDLILNDLSFRKILDTKLIVIQALNHYFKDKSIVITAFMAGLTIVLSLFFTTFLSKILFNFYIPNNINNLLKFNILSFILGYIIDVIIDKTKLFGKSLDPYYKVAGSGFWGAVAYLFSINVSYMLGFIICNMNKKNLLC